MISENILSAFEFSGRYIGAEELKSGNINTTYALSFGQKDGSMRRYVVQRINTDVFKDPHSLMKNIELVTEHIAAAGVDDARRLLKYVKCRQGGKLYRDAEGKYWRACQYIEGATAYDLIEQPRHFYEAGRGFGEFQRLLCDFSAEKLTATIPDFHNTVKRLEAFERAVEQDAAGRVSEVGREIDFVRSKGELAGKIIELTEAGILPLRVTHNDTKLNNVMIDNDSGEAICVIDLDTVMSGSLLYDYGDAIRFGACTAAEDEPDVSKIDVDMQLFRLFTDGFVSKISDRVTTEEIRELPLGVTVMTYESAIRFLTDYINGDTYFKIKYPEHNLVRARAQIKLLDAIEAHIDEMREYVCGFLTQKTSN